MAAAEACEKVITTIAQIRARIKTIEEANIEIEAAQGVGDRAVVTSEPGVELLHHEGFEDADEDFKQVFVFLSSLLNNRLCAQ